jgi:O-antigen ligase
VAEPPTSERAPHRASVALYLTMAGITLMGFNLTRVAGMPIADLVFMAAAAAIAFDLLAGRTANLAPPAARRGSPPVVLATIVFLTAGVISAFQSWDSGYSITVVLRFAWVTLGWFWVLRSVAVDRAALRKLFGAWRVMLLLNSAVAVLGQLGIAQFGPTHGSGRQTAFFDEPNNLAGLLVIGLPVVLLGLPRSEEPGLVRGRELVSRGMPTLLVGYAVAATGSMSAFLAAFAGGATIVASLALVSRPVRPRGRRSPLLPLVVLLAVAVGLAGLASSDLPVVERFTEYRAGDAYVRGSVGSRSARNEQVIERFDELLVVGTGFGGFNPNDREEVEAGGAHNMLVLTVLQTGLPGLIGLLLLLLFTLRNCLRVMVSTRGTQLFVVAVCLLASLVIANTFAMFQPLLYQRLYWLPVGMIGALWSLRRQELRVTAR